LTVSSCRTAISPKVRTLLEGGDLIQSVSLSLLSLKTLLRLNLLSKLLQLPLCLGPLTSLDRRILIQKTLTDLGHMIVRLDHLCEIIRGPLKDATFLSYPVPSQHCGLEGLVVEGDFAVEIIVGVGDVDGLCGSDRLGLGPGDIGGEGDLFTETLQRRLDGEVVIISKVRNSCQSLQVLKTVSIVAPQLRLDQYIVLGKSVSCALVLLLLLQRCCPRMSPTRSR